MVSDVSLEMQSDSKNYVGLQDDEITEPVHTIKSACASTGGGPARSPDERKKETFLFNVQQTGKSLNHQNGFITTLERLSCHRHFKITQAQTKVGFFCLNLYYKLNLERFSSHFYTFS